MNPVFKAATPEQLAKRPKPPTPMYGTSGLWEYANMVRAFRIDMLRATSIPSIYFGVDYGRSSKSSIAFKLTQQGGKNV